MPWCIRGLSTSLYASLSTSLYASLSTSLCEPVHLSLPVKHQRASVGRHAPRMPRQTVAQ